MKATQRARRARGCVLASVAALLFLACDTRERRAEEQARALTEAIACQREALAARRARIERRTAGWLSESISVRTPWLTQDRLDRLEAVSLATDLASFAPGCSLELRDVAVQAGEPDTLVRGELTYSDSQAGDLHARSYEVELALRSGDGGELKLRSVSIFPRVQDLPEARP